MQQLATAKLNEALGLRLEDSMVRLLITGLLRTLA